MPAILRSVVNLSSSAHDVLQQQKLAALLEGDCDSTVKVDLVSELLKSTRTSSGKIKMLLDIVECPRLRVGQVRDIIGGLGEGPDDDKDDDDEEEEEEQERKRRTPQSLSNCVAALRKMLDLFDFLSSVAKEGKVPKLSGECSAEDAKSALGCDDRIAQKISSVLQVGPKGF